MLLFFTGWRLPGPVDAAVGYLGSMNTPLAMVVIGGQMAPTDLRRRQGQGDKAQQGGQGDLLGGQGGVPAHALGEQAGGPGGGGRALMGGRRELSLKKLALNPGILGFAAGLLLFFTGCLPLPGEQELGQQHIYHVYPRHGGEGGDKLALAGRGALQCPGRSTYPE